MIGAMIMSFIFVTLILLTAYFPMREYKEPLLYVTTKLEAVRLVASRRATRRLLAITFTLSFIVDTIIAYLLIQNEMDTVRNILVLSIFPVVLLITLLFTVQDKLESKLFDSSYLILKAKWDRQEDKDRIKRETKEGNLKRMDELDGKWNK